jgi:hypothetical protein
VVSELYVKVLKADQLNRVSGVETLEQFLVAELHILHFIFGKHHILSVVIYGLNL